MELSAGIYGSPDGSRTSKEPEILKSDATRIYRVPFFPKKPMIDVERVSPYENGLIQLSLF